MQKKSIQHALCKYALLCSCLFLLNIATKASEPAEMLQRSEVTISLRNASLKDVFNQIESQTQLVFIYNNAVVNNQKQVSISVDREPVQEILGKVLEGTGLVYLVNDKYIILKKEPELQSVAQQNRNIRGTVTDALGEPIIGANVSIKGTTTGTITDIDGHFTLEVPENARLTVSYIGYIPIELSIGVDFR